MKNSKISVNAVPATGKLPTASSKFFGNPDMWQGFEWPEYLDIDGELSCMDFICQINCADLCRLDVGGAFPEKGMLYLFYPLEDTPFSLHDSDPVCYYYGGEPSALEEFVLKFDDGSFAASDEQIMEFSIADDDDEMKYPDHHLLGEPSVYPFDGDAVGLEDKILLFELYSFKTADRSISFWDDGTLQFYIAPDRLKSGDVSEVQVRLNTT